MNVHPPLFVFEDLDVIVCDSVAEAESSVERLDVLTTGYRVFDSEGRKFRFEIVPEPSVGEAGKEVVLAQEEDGLAHQDERGQMLAASLDALGVAPRDDSLEVLVEEAQRYFRPRS